MGYINAMNYDENQMDDIAQVLTDAGWTVKEGHNNLGYYDSSSEGSSYDNAMYKLLNRNKLFIRIPRPVTTMK